MNELKPRHSFDLYSDASHGHTRRAYSSVKTKLIIANGLLCMNAGYSATKSTISLGLRSALPLLQPTTSTMFLFYNSASALAGKRFEFLCNLAESQNFVTAASYFAMCFRKSAFWFLERCLCTAGTRTFNHFARRNT